MPSPLQRNVARLVSAVMAGVAFGCVHPYEQPNVNEPHAVVKVRLSYHDHPGIQLTERIRLNDYDIVMPPDETLRATPVAQAVRIRPEPAAWNISSNFYHTYTTTTLQTTSYKCGSTTCTRSSPVTMTHTVSDGSCQQSLTFVPMTGAIYLLQYDFLGADQCSLLCLRQLPAGGDQFITEPCRTIPNSES